MRKFQSYKKELSLDCFKIGNVLKKGVINNDVKKVQEWLCINSIMYNSLKPIEIDEKFGKITESAIKDFQSIRKIPITGIVDESTFFELTKPLRNSFIIKDLVYNNFRDLICKIALKHFENYSRELSYNKVNNLGPWVRSYCNGSDGEDYWWCCGFVKTIIDIACDINKSNFDNIMVNTLSCDKVADMAISNNRLIRNNELKERIGEIEPGDIFFKYSPDKGNLWHHIGIITKVQRDGSIDTIEGNASMDIYGNIGDTSNGTGVSAKRRDLFSKKQLIDEETGKKYWDCYEVYKLDI